MSYILEALKKADRERNLGEVPDLDAAHWGERNHRRTGYWPWLAAALLLANAGLLAYLFSHDTAEVADDSAPVSMTPSDRPPVAAIPSDTEPLQRLARPEREPPREMRPRVKPPAPAPAARPQPQVATPATEVAPAPSPQVVQAPTPLSSGSGGDGTLPEWSELPLEFRGGFALPHIDVHVYADEPARRFVLIDLAKYREGDTLASGAVLEKINPGSIELFFQGRRFRVDR
ncbi:MAG: general secretion pathway protein GspB [Pseudomonadota bacterium]